VADKNRKKLWMCIRSYKCSVRVCTAYEAFAKPFKRLCHHNPPKECRAAGRCLAVPIEVVLRADDADHPPEPSLLGELAAEERTCSRCQDNDIWTSPKCGKCTVAWSGGKIERACSDFFRESAASVRERAEKIIAKSRK
jgi:hypothetical protein